MKTKKFHELRAAVREASARDAGLFPVRFLKWKSEAERGRVTIPARKLVRGK